MINQEKFEYLIKIFHLKYSLPIMMSIVSIFFWISEDKYDIEESVGIAINFVGLLLWWIAKITLAENWNVGFGKPKITKLVTQGIYSKIAHPMYWGIILTLLGLLFLYSEIWFLLLCILFILYFYLRMKKEERYLIEKLGEEYLKYKRGVWI